MLSCLGDVISAKKKKMQAVGEIDNQQRNKKNNCGKQNEGN